MQSPSYSQRVMSTITSVGKVKQLLQVEFLLLPIPASGRVGVVVRRLFVNRRPEVRSDVINGGIYAISVQSAFGFGRGNRETSFPQVSPHLSSEKVDLSDIYRKLAPWKFENRLDGPSSHHQRSIGVKDEVYHFPTGGLVRNGGASSSYLGSSVW